MKLRRKPEPERKPKGYLMRFDRDVEHCTCRWEPLGFDPVSFNTDVVFVRESESLPAVAAGHVHYCRLHGGQS